jgi:malonyl-[acp] decarboxylase
MAAAPADIVITSAALLTSVAASLDDFAAALRGGRSGVAVADLPATTHVTAAALFNGAAPGAPAPPRAAPGDAVATAAVTGGTGPQAAPLSDAERARQLHVLTSRCTLPTRTAAKVASQAVLAARLDRGQLASTAVVIGGNNLALGYQARVTLGAAAGNGSVMPSHALAHLDIDAVGAVSEVTGAVAEGCTIGGSSASGALALIHGCRLLALDVADHCIVVGALSELSPAEYRALHDSGAMAGGAALPPAAVCRPFDRRRSGFVHGHAAAAVVLERRDAARRRGVRPLAVIAGHAQRLDGRRGTEPRPQRQAETIGAALASAGLGPGDIDYVNAHATGSLLGDRSEAEALHRVFGRARPLVNSTKELVGHCLAAAGVVEAVATVLQIRDGFCHPNPNLTDPEDTRLNYVGRRAARTRVRTAVSTSFAFSGINAALVITQAEDT